MKEATSCAYVRVLRMRAALKDFMSRQTEKKDMLRIDV